MTENATVVDIPILERDETRLADGTAVLVDLWDRIKPAMERGGALTKLDCFVSGDVLTVEFRTLG